MRPLLPRTRFRLRTYCIAAFVVLLGATITLKRQNKNLRQRISQNYARAFSQLADSMGNLDTALEKSVYVTTPEMISALCSEIYSDACAARLASAALPYSHVELEQTTSFAVKVGDYAQALAKSASVHNGYQEEERENLKALSHTAAVISQQLDELEAQLYDGTMTLEDVELVQKRLSEMDVQEHGANQGSFAKLEADFPELPTLIYDGPFSEHLQSRRSAMLDQEQTVSADQAKKKAAAFLELEPSVLSGGELVEGQIPAYRFHFSTETSPDCTISMTQNGGYVLEITNGRWVDADSMDETQALSLAKEWLETHQITDMKESYSLRRDNAVTINFACVQEGVICYPDLLKVEVALDNGEIVGMESAGYLMNHTHREDLSPEISYEQAQTRVSPELKILSRHLVLIPTQGGKEKLCWEFRCENDERKHYLVYINGKTGAEEEILILLEDESGTLAL